MMPGCFATTLLKQQVVRFLVDHDEGQLVATTEDGLKLYSDEIGLAFTLSVPDTDAGYSAYSAVKSGDLPCMSVGYESLETERKVIDGDDVYFVRTARLNEISLVKRGAVSQAYAKIIDRPDLDLVRAASSRAADTNAIDSQLDALKSKADIAASAVADSFADLQRLLGKLDTNEAHLG